MSFPSGETSTEIEVPSVAVNLRVCWDASDFSISHASAPSSLDESDAYEKKAGDWGGRSKRTNHGIGEHRIPSWSDAAFREYLPNSRGPIIHQPDLPEPLNRTTSSIGKTSCVFANVRYEAFG